MISSPEKYEIRIPPVDQILKDAAKAQPNAWVYEIDYKYPDDQPVPPEAIRGAWETDASGEFTGRYVSNDHHRPIVTLKPDLKPYMYVGARTNRDQWIVDIDPRGESSFPDIPQHLIRGWWYVDKNGVITDQFRPISHWDRGA